MVESDMVLCWSARKNCFLAFSLRPWHERHVHLCQMMLAFHVIGLEAEVGTHALFIRNTSKWRNT